MISKVVKVEPASVKYDNGMKLKIHNSGLISIMFNTKERWCDKAEISGFDPKIGLYYFGLWFSSEDLEYNEEILLEWPSHLGSKADFRSLSEQNKDQVELFFIPWEMLK